MHNTRASRFLILAAITTGHSCDPLEMLLASLLVAPGTLFDVLDDDVRRHTPAAD
jgi:hypothetical protein